MKPLRGVKFAFGTKLAPVPFFPAEQWQEIRAQWKQVHGIKIVEVLSLGQVCGEIDGMWTQEKNIPISVVSADCIPVVLYREDQKAIAVLHAGWRGVLKHISNAFFKNLPEALSRPEDWCAVIGPSIRACCYKFGELETEAFTREFENLKRLDLCPRPGFLNIVAPLEEDLKALKISNIQISEVCTYCARDGEGNLLHFSYRRGDRLSRQYTTAILSEREASRA